MIFMLRVSNCTQEGRVIGFLAKDEMLHTLRDMLISPNHVEFVNPVLGTEEAKSVDTLTCDMTDTPRKSPTLDC